MKSGSIAHGSPVYGGLRSGVRMYIGFLNVAMIQSAAPIMAGRKHLSAPSSASASAAQRR